MCVLTPLLGRNARWHTAYNKAVRCLYLVLVKTL